MRTRSRVGLVLLIGVLASGSALAWVAQQRFDHWQHRALFPTCVGCHAGAAEPTAALWPAPANCAECHDSAIRKAVDWSTAVGPTRQQPHVHPRRPRRGGPPGETGFKPAVSGLPR